VKSSSELSRLLVCPICGILGTTARNPEVRVSAPEAWKSPGLVGFICLLSTFVYFSWSQVKILFRQTGYQMVHEPSAEDTAGYFALNVHEMCAESLTLAEATRRTSICLHLQKPVLNYPHIHNLSSQMM